MNQPNIAFLGLGLMGGPMATNLLKAGFPVNAWNRDGSKAAALASLGAKPAANIAAAVAEADIVVTMLLNDQAVRDVLEQAAPSLKPGTLVIDMSSTTPALARRLGDNFRAQGINFLDAPVSGGAVGAAEATLAIMAGGSAEDIARAAGVFAALGRVTHVGPNGAGQLAKLANQAIVAITIGAVAEGLLLASAGGADPAAVRNAIKGGFAQSRILDLHGERMITRSFAPGGMISTQIKDLRNILDEARAHNLRLPLVEKVFDLFQGAEALGHGALDHSAEVLAVEAMNGNRRVG